LNKKGGEKRMADCPKCAKRAEARKLRKENSQAAVRFAESKQAEFDSFRKGKKA